MRVRAASILAVVTMAAAGLVVVTAGPIGAAALSIAPTATSVAVGSTLTATPTGCVVADEIEGPDGSFSYRRLEVKLITGSGDAARLAALGAQREDSEQGQVAFAVPGWVDAAQPAVLAGRCIEESFDRSGQSQTVLFTYSDVSIDITAGPASAPAPTFSLDRDTAAGGQVLTVTGQGCGPGSYAQVLLLTGADLSGRELGEVVVYGDTFDGDEPVDGGRFTQDLALNDRPEFDDGDPGAAGGPLDEGDYKVLVACEGYNADFTIAAPQAVHVVGAKPSGDIVLAPGGSGSDSYVISGQGCLGGQVVTLRTIVDSGDSDLLDVSRQRGRALRRGSVGDAITAGGPAAGTRMSRAARANAESTRTVTPGADGAWSATIAVPDSTSFYVRVIAECGDAHVDGFRYVERSAYESNVADIYLDRISPTSAPPARRSPSTETPIATTVSPPA